MDNRPLKKRIKYGLIYYFIRFLIFVSNIIPRRVWISFCGFLGRISWVFLKQTRELSLTHLKIAFGAEKSTAEIVALSKESFRMLGKNAGDVLRARAVRSLKDIQKFVIMEGYENFEAANAKKKGVVFVACHLGAFDLEVTLMSLLGWQPNVIGTALKDEKLNELLFDYRNAYGAVAIERGKETLRLLRTLKKGGLVALLIDQDTKVKSTFVNFFGRRASTPVGATVLALKTGAAMVPTCIYLGEDGMQHMQIFPEIPAIITGDDEKDISINTQACTTFIEQLIRQHPEQWVWMHERWKTEEHVAVNS